MSFEVFNFIEKKKAGMSIVCNVIAKGLESKAKGSAKWTDRTSNARQGLNSSSEGHGNNYSIFLGHGVSYGAILEDGSKPHIITPKNGKYLYWKGAAHPVKVVHHPGTEGFKTIENTLEGNKDMVMSAIVKYWSD